MEGISLDRGFTKEAQLPKNSLKKFYASTLGLQRFPKEVKDIPESVKLPIESLGDMGEAIRALLRDPTNRERGQDIFCKRDKFSKTKLVIGSSNKANQVHEAKAIVRSYLGQTAFLAFHTHPDEAGFSDEDIASFRASPKRSLINAVVSPERIIALLRTKKAVF